MIISPVGLVSLPMTHSPDFINVEKFSQNLKISFGTKSFPKTPLIPEIDIFTIQSHKGFL